MRFGWAVTPREHRVRRGNALRRDRGDIVKLRGTTTHEGDGM
ncbi:MAG TPA: hypothetical protein VF618_02495 [Thermoanaerobaculia bacterium]